MPATMIMPLHRPNGGSVRHPRFRRFLLKQGATADIFIAAALGDSDLVAQLVSKDPTCVAMRIGRLGDFPPIGCQGHGGTILQWTLAFNSYPHQIALAKGHDGVFDFLYEYSDPQTRLLVCCVLARREEAEGIARQYPYLVANLPSLDLELWRAIAGKRTPTMKRSALCSISASRLTILNRATGTHRCTMLLGRATPRWSIF